MNTKANLKTNVPASNEIPNIKNYEGYSCKYLFIFIS